MVWVKAGRVPILQKDEAPPPPLTRSKFMLLDDGPAAFFKYDRTKVNRERSGSEMQTTTTQDDKFIIALQKQGYTRNQAENLMSLSNGLAEFAIQSSNLVKKLIQTVVH